MNSRIAICACLIVGIALFISMNQAAGSLCQSIQVSSTYPHQASSTQQIEFSTNVAGSCASDGEDYFSVRVDIVDRSANAIPSSNSVPIGYNAKNFSVTVNNTAVTPQGNMTWPLEIDVYVTESGGLNGNYLLNATNATIQVGSVAVSEFYVPPAVMIPIVLFALMPLLQPRLRVQFRSRIFEERSK